MLYIIAAITVGALAYAIMIAIQPREARADRSKWQENCRTTAIASIMCFGYVIWRSYGDTSGASGRPLLGIVPFDQPYLSVLCAAGYAAASFAILAGVWVASLWFRSNGQPHHDA